MSLRSEPTSYKVAILGAGFGGLGMAAQLKDAGEDSFVILEKSGPARRDLAREHLSRMRLRCSFAPLLVFL